MPSTTAAVRDDVRTFLEHAVRVARAEPDDPPLPHLITWQRHLAASLGVLPRHARTNRELLDGALRLQRLVRGLPDPIVTSPPFDARRAHAAMVAAVPYPSPA
ncbi:MAG: hypothetical protein QOD86_197 [Miltoncostaeaceae bacterium]|jgi:hypothetical protein|nr:hypothetical protein [Miltoncostaeaceae bacterium]